MGTGKQRVPRVKFKNRLDTDTAELSVLTINDLTWLGHAKFPLEGDRATDAGTSDETFGAIAVRYANNESAVVERLYLMANFSVTEDTWIGDLVEYRAPTLTTGAITSANTMIEVRRWHADDAFPRVSDTQWGGQNGLVHGVFWVPSLTDADGGVLVITTGGDYNGADSGHAQIYAVKLSNTMIDADYATVVQRYGPWAYGGSVSGPSTEWKEANRGLITIPESARADLGGASLAFQGAYSSFSSPDHLQYGPNLRGITAFPTLATSSPWNSGDTITRGNKIMSHAFNDASPFGNANVSSTITEASYVIRQEWHVNDGGTIRNYDASPVAMGADVNDALYIEIYKYDTSATVNFWAYMSTPCTSGTKVWEYWNGSAWTDCTSSLTWSHGNANLTANKNNAYFTSGNSSVLTGWATSTQNGVSTYWIRGRNTVAPSVAGIVKNAGFHTTGGAVGLTGQNWFPAVSEHVGLAWVETSTKHGVVTFARIASGYVWYGSHHGFIGSAEVAAEDDFAETFELTIHGYRAQYVNPSFLIYDPMQIRAAAANGTRANIGPPTEANWATTFPTIPHQYANLADNDLRYLNIWQANALFWDGSNTAGGAHTVANQLIWTPPRTSLGTGNGGAMTLQVFSVP